MCDCSCHKGACPTAPPYCGHDLCRAPREIAVDPKVYELTQDFIEDVMPMPREEIGSDQAQRLVKALAAHVQTSIEDWIEYEKRPGGLLS